MKKGLFLILPCLVLPLLGGCEKENTSNNNVVSSVDSTINSSVDSVKTDSSVSSSNSNDSGSNNNENLKIVVPVKPVLNMGLPIFAVLKDGLEGKVKWESSDPNIISITSRSSTENPNDSSLDFKTEGSFWTKKTGKVTITATLEGTNIKSSIELGLDDNYSEMDETLYSSVTSSLKATSIENTKTFNNKLEQLTDEDTYQITTIFEENIAPTSNETNYTDAYQLIEKDLLKDKVTINQSRVKSSTGVGYTAVEEINIYNELNYSPVTNNEGEKFKFNDSYYINFLKKFDHTQFVSYDNKQTYHYIGGYVGMEDLAYNFTMNKDFYPDDIYFEVDNNQIVSLNFVVAPFKSKESDTTYYSTTLKATFSDLNTAKIDHLKPYKASDAVNEKLEKAKKNLIDGKNYTCVTNIKSDNGEVDKKIQSIFTQNTIDQIVTDNKTNASAHSGLTIIDNKLISYKYDDSTKVVTKVSDLEGTIDKQYPTFDFSNDIFYDDNGSYKTQQTFGSEIIECSGYLTKDLKGMVNGASQGVVSFENDNIKEIKGTLYSLTYETNVNVTMEFTDVGSSEVDIDFSKLNTPSKDSWETNPGLSTLLSNMKECHMDDKLPYLLPSVGYNNSVFKVQNGYKLNIDGKETDVSSNCSYIKTGVFNTEDDANSFMNEYIALIKSKGYQLTSAKLVDEKEIIDLYQKAGTDYYIGVANIHWNNKVIYIYACGGDVTIPNI